MFDDRRADRTGLDQPDTSRFEREPANRPDRPDRRAAREEWDAELQFATTNEFELAQLNLYQAINRPTRTASGRTLELIHDDILGRDTALEILRQVSSLASVDPHALFHTPSEVEGIVSRIVFTDALFELPDHTIVEEEVETATAAVDEHGLPVLSGVPAFLQSCVEDRHLTPQQVVGSVLARDPDDAIWVELRDLLHAEISRLPQPAGQQEQKAEEAEFSLSV